MQTFNESLYDGDCIKREQLLASLNQLIANLSDNNLKRLIYFARGLSKNKQNTKTHK